MTIEFFANTDADIFVVLPTLTFRRYGDECRNEIALEWGFWAAGVAVYPHS